MGRKDRGGDTEISGYPATCLLPEDIKNYFQSDFYAFVLSKYKDELSQPVVDETVEFLDALELYFSGQILIPDFDLELKDKYTKYNARLYEIEGQIQGEGKSDFLDQINSDMAEGGVLSNFQTHLVNTLLNELEHNTTVRSLFEQSAKENREHGQRLLTRDNLEWINIICPERLRRQVWQKACV